ncbi:MAG: DMT family transporter [Candidatus Marinimicrobia bacterium]|nr:DMT family transporter [Candidatus Neomarinimicrobiota bacterium]
MMPNQTHRAPSTLAPDMVLLSAALVWGGTFALIKQALGHTTPFMFMTLRFALAFVIITVPVIWRAFMVSGNSQPWLRITRREWIGGILTGVALFVGFTFQTWGLVYTTASRSAFITGLNVLLVPFFLWGVNHQIISGKRWISVALAAGGLYLLIDPSAGNSINLGDGLTLVCAVAFAGQIILLGIYAPTVDTLRYFWVQLLTMVILSALSVLATGAAQIRPDPALWWGLIITGVLGTAGAFLGMTWAQRRVSPTRTALFLTTEPLFGALFAVMFAGEYLSPTAWLGGLLIVTVIVWAELGTVNRPAGPAEHGNG